MFKCMLQFSWNRSKFLAHGCSRMLAESRVVLCKHTEASRSRRPYLRNDVIYHEAYCKLFMI